MLVQFLALSAAYFSLVERALPVWAAQVTPQLLGSRWVQTPGCIIMASQNPCGGLPQVLVTSSAQSWPPWRVLEDYDNTHQY